MALNMISIKGYTMGELLKMICQDSATNNVYCIADDLFIEMSKSPGGRNVITGYKGNVTNHFSIELLQEELCDEITILNCIDTIKRFLSDRK